jgi:riboflavin kinase/FMN adenylyltransferase
MKVIEWQQFLEKGLPLEKKASVTIGVFDGVHRGHRALLERIVSHNADYIPVVVTFRQNLKGEKRTDNIQTFEQKTAILESLGIKILLAVDFTKSFRQMPGIDFLEILLKKINIGFFAVGNDFRCGYRLDTDAAAIRDFFALRNIPVEIISEIMEGSLPISSRRIRAAIAAGDIALAQAMLNIDIREGSS